MSDKDVFASTYEKFAAKSQANRDVTVSDTPRTDRTDAVMVMMRDPCVPENLVGFVRVQFARQLERDLREAVAALKLAYPLLTDKAVREEIGELLNRIEGK
jgi:hypothetical protein